MSWVKRPANEIWIPSSFNYLLSYFILFSYQHGLASTKTIGCRCFALRMAKPCIHDSYNSSLKITHPPRPARVYWSTVPLADTPTPYAPFITSSSSSNHGCASYQSMIMVLPLVNVSPCGSLTGAVTARSVAIDRLRRVHDGRFCRALMWFVSLAACFLTTVHIDFSFLILG
ncbi:MAG: hypothetical protein QOI20_3438 [Acidimicrobiaceae bacterium]|nr:hypothetical protein [Acidimicrobiaceae bacterium]